MDNQLKNNSSSQTAPHPESFYKDEWVLSRKSLRAGGLIIDHHLEPPDEIEVESTNYHHLGYLLSDFAPRQVTRMDGKEYDGTNRKGDIWLKPAHTNAFWHWESSDEALVFTIEPAYLRKIAAEVDCPHPDRIEVLPIVHSRDRYLDNMVTMFVHEMNHAQLGSFLALESLVDLFMVHLLRYYCAFPNKIEEQPGGLSRIQLKQAIDYINENIDRSLKVSEIAEVVEISQYHFSRQFKKSTGLTPHEYVTQQRIIKAKQLLKDRRIPLNDIVRHCGFTHQSHMGRMFKEYLGTTPKKYRDEMLG